MKKVNDSQLNLLKIVSMFFIVMWHNIVLTNLLSCFTDNILSKIFLAIPLFLIVHVNTFVMVTGYYQHDKKSKIKKVFNLYIQVVFYSVLAYFIAVGFNLLEFDGHTLFKLFLPSSIREYWFIAEYMILYLLSDYINIIIEKLSKKDYQKLLLLLFIIFSIVPFLTAGRLVNNSGYSFVHFINLYFLGAYLKKFPLKEEKIFKNMSNGKYRLILWSTLILVFVANYFLIIWLSQPYVKHDLILSTIAARTNDSIYSYARPFVVIQSLLFFELFNSHRFKSKSINFISASTLAVYLFSGSPFIKEEIYKLFNLGTEKIGDYWFILKFIDYAIIIFVVCILVDFIRRFIFWVFAKIFNKKERQM